MSAPAPQSGPIVVYGASGYTGRLVSGELARRGAGFVVAGRSREKLESLVGSLDAEPAIAAVGLDDAAGLRSLLEGAAAVIACAGPFTLHGDAVLDAAVATGTHYVDTTGEQPFIRACFDRDEAARRSGASVVSGMGFDYLPGDLLAHLTGEGLGRLAELTLAYSIRGFGATRGTTLSALEMMRGGDVEWTGGEWREADRSTGRGRFDFPSPIGRKRVGRYPAGEQITVPRHLEVDAVRTLIDLHSVAPRQLGPLAAPLATATGYLMSSPVRGLAGRLIERLPEGPPRDARQAVRYAIVCEARPSAGEGDSRGARRGVLHGSDVYGTTALTTVEGALTMATPGYDRAGALAPAQAFEPAAFLASLGEHGVRYELAELG